MSTHSSILVWRIPWIEKPGGLLSMGLLGDWIKELEMVRDPVCCAVLCLVTHLCPTLCDPMDCSPPGDSVRGVLQTRILEWVDMPSSRGSSQPRDRTGVSCIAGRFFTS